MARSLTPQQRRNRRRSALPGVGTFYTFVELVPESKLILNWFVGERDARTVSEFLTDLGEGVPGTFQLFTDTANVLHEVAKTAVDVGMQRKDRRSN